MRDWFVEQRSPTGATGSADLVAYFFLRAHAAPVQRPGTLGLIATNTVAQGDTREVGLDQMVDGRLHDHAGDSEPTLASRQCQPRVCRRLGHAKARLR